MTTPAITHLRIFLASADGLPDDTMVARVQSGAPLLLSDLRALLALIPSGEQTEKYLAIQTLRDAGWTVSPPAAPEDPIPVPEPGQVWRSPKPRIMARTIDAVRDDGRGRRYVYVLSHGSDGRQFATFLDGWMAWARKVGARPVTEAAP